MYRLINTRSPFYLQFTSAGNEPEATNLMGYSEKLDQWGGQNISATSDVTTYAGQPLYSPDGAQTADLFARTTTGADYISKSAQKGNSLAQEYTLSVFVKRGTSRYVSFRAQGLYPDRLDTQYDFETMQFSVVSNYGTDIEYISSHVEQYNGWTRIGITVLSDTHTSIIMGLSPKNDANEGTDSNDSSSDANVFLWGAQVEEGTAMTSYIQNPFSAQATRAESTSFNEQDVTLTLSIYTGAFTDNPTETTYTLVKSPINGLTTFEFSELIRDYIEQNSNVSDGSVWVRATMSDGVQFDKEFDFLATEGYNTRVNGVQTIYNTDFEAKLMQTNTDVVIPDGMTLNIPVYANQNTSYSIDGATDVDFSTPSTNGDYIQSISVSSTDSVVEVKNFDSTIATINVSVAECSKYPVNMLTFVNKSGTKQELYFDMKSEQKVSAKSKDFRRNTLDYADLTANSLKHTTKKMISDSIESFKLNTGFLTENNSLAIEELLVSEYVWLTQEDSTVIPVNITDSSVKRKTHLNDKLIQYTINVEASAPYLNNFR